MRLTLFAVGLLAALWNTPAYAQACDPELILRDNVEIVTLDRETAYALSQRRESTSSRASNRTLGFISGQDELSAADGARSFSQLQSSLNVQFTEQQRQTLFRRALSSQSVAAWEACLGSRPTRVEYVGNPFTSQRFGVRITWQANQGPPEATLRVRVRNGISKGCRVKLVKRRRAGRT